MSTNSTAKTRPLVWLVTGCTSGFGRLFVPAILARGDRVIATARDIESLPEISNTKDVFLLQLDVTDSQESLYAKAATAIERFGEVNVLVNNAGYVLSGVWEEVSHEQVVDQFRTNFFGHMNVTRAFLPNMRSRRSGTVVFMSSIAGWLGVAAGGPYSASKFALEGAVESLQKEVCTLGIRVHLIVLGQFRTSILDDNRRKISRPNPAVDDYNSAVNTLALRQVDTNGKQPGNPTLAVERILDAVRREGMMATREEIPLRIVLGSDAGQIVRAQCLETLQQLDKLQEIGRSTDFLDARGIQDYK
ncbi:hypothetical protein BDW59DRAFT_179603 [Aspergillus cavernicola]|uniref:NAD(P)-binding protein n=1 Tax=Aspergillus cavernicola TaxID=176166 RepID=A0ABR4IEV4_9EURO